MLVFNGCGFSVSGNGKILEMDSGDGGTVM